MFFAGMSMTNKNEKAAILGSMSIAQVIALFKIKVCYHAEQDPMSQTKFRVL